MVMTSDTSATGIVDSKDAAKADFDKDRRAYPRCRALVLFRRDDTERLRCVRDIGEGGLGVMSDEPLERGHQFDAELYFPAEDERLEQGVEVVWRRRLPPMAAAKYLLGLAFRLPSEPIQERIASISRSPQP